MKKTTKKMAFIAIFAAVNFVVFSYCKIDIPLQSGHVAIHVANAIVVVSALLLGPVEGGLAGAIGLSIADILDPRYITSAPKTFLLKFFIGFIAGTCAKKMKLNEAQNKKEMNRTVLISAVAGLGFNVIFDPLIGYLYKHYILQLNADTAKIVTAWASGVTLFNAIVCIFVTLILYTALHKSFEAIFRK